MVLDDVADRSGLIVEAAAALDAEIFRHGDLHALDVVAVPERLHEGVGETEDDHIVYWPLPQVMVDSENRGFVEFSKKDLIQMSRGLQIVTERLFNDDAGVGGAAAMRQLFEHRFEHSGWDGKVVRRPLRRLQFPAQRLEGL